MKTVLLFSARWISNGTTIKTCCKWSFNSLPRLCNILRSAETYGFFWRLELWCSLSCAAYASAWKKEICRQGCIEKMQPLSAREKHTQPVISIADASDRKWEKASCIQPESEHCPRTTQQFYCMLQCGSGVRIQWLEFTVDMCGIQGFPLITAKCQSEDVVARKQNKA